jgi:hypothetical protein
MQPFPIYWEEEFIGRLRYSRVTDNDCSPALIKTIRAMLALFVHGSIGKGVLSRLAQESFRPPVGLVLGAGISTVDTFLMEKIFPLSGPSLFLSRMYRSLFKDEGWF